MLRPVTERSAGVAKFAFTTNLPATAVPAWRLIARGPRTKVLEKPALSVALIELVAWILATPSSWVRTGRPILTVNVLVVPTGTLTFKLLKATCHEPGVTSGRADVSAILPREVVPSNKAIWSANNHKRRSKFNQRRLIVISEPRALISMAAAGWLTSPLLMTTLFIGVAA